MSEPRSEIGPPIEQQVWAAIRQYLDAERTVDMMTNAVIEVVNPWAERLIEVAVRAAVEAALYGRST